MKKSILIFLLTLLPCFSAVKEFTMTTNKTNIALEESLIIEATLLTDKKENIDIPEFPKSENYTIIHRDSRSRHSSNYSNINGKVTQENNYYTTYLYQVFFPKEGEITLPSLSVTVDGKEYRTKPITFSVGSEKREQEISLRYIQPRDKIFLGESAPLTVQILIKSNSSARLTNAGISRLMQSLEDQMKPKAKADMLIQSITPRSKVINGISHDIYNLPYTITALDTGEIELPALFLPYVEQVEKKRYDSFFGRYVPYTDNVSHNLKTPSLHYTIKELPSAPANYSGIVGEVALSAKLSKKEVPAGEGVTLTVTANGYFHEKAIDSLILPKMENIDHFTPEKSSITDTTTKGLRSAITFNYMLIPQIEGEETIPPLEVVWFDPKTETYKTTKSQSFSLTVTKGEKQLDSATKRYLSKSLINKVGSDIGYIKTEKPKSGEEASLYPKKHFSLLLSIPWLISLLLCAYKLFKKLSPTNAAAEGKKRAFGKAIKELQAIETKKSDASPVTVLERYFSEKLSLNSASLRRDELSEALAKEKIDSQIIETLLSYLDKVEMSRYAGGGDSQALVKEAEKLLRTIEKEVA